MRTSIDSFDDFHILAQRLAQLERHNRRLRHALALVGVAAGALVFMGQAALRPRTVEVETLTLVDRAGQRRATLAAPGGGVVLTLYAPEGRWQAQFEVTDEPNLVLADRQGPVLTMPHGPPIFRRLPSAPR